MTKKISIFVPVVEHRKMLYITYDTGYNKEVHENVAKLCENWSDNKNIEILKQKVKELMKNHYTNVEVRPFIPEGVLN